MRLTGQIAQKYGFKKEIVRDITQKVIMPAVLYASEMWGHRADTVLGRRHLDAATRPILLLCSGAYRTTSNAAIQAIAGISPVWIEARERRHTYIQHKEDILKIQTRTTDRPHPSLVDVQVPTDIQDSVEVWVDACNGQRNSGLGLVVYRNGHRVIETGVTLTRINNSQKAEMLAILNGIMLAKQQGQHNMIIH
ncbi:uncharacterized protein LOC126742846 [Anthonomus grandis grandis]|uniref:uncharacterized protein LOC126742846 n=1 Tax=Anthonomus grandis grandis TaxID=2921223 RepID=UPI002165AFF2|nr:uncharacterized protein LOC126742846 [Anthonomus grandis grandis]